MFNRLDDVQRKRPTASSRTQSWQEVIGYLKELKRKVQVKGSRSENVGIAKNLETRIESLGLTRWRWEVEALLLEGDQNDKPGAAAEALLTEARQFEDMRNLTKNQLIRQLIWLELDVWKARLASDPFFSTLGRLDFRTAWSDWSNPDLVLKTSETAGVVLIVQGNLPFWNENGST